MKQSIQIKKIWFDDDLIELNILVSKGNSTFSNNVYVNHDKLRDVVKDLDTFKEQIHGGIYDLKFGAFGPEFGRGGFEARLNFHIPGRLNVSTYQQSDYEEFSTNHKVASEARLHLKFVPAALDRFVSALKSLSAGDCEEATLESDY